MKESFFATVAAFMVTTGMSHASDEVIGEATLFTSPNGVEEKCVRIAPIPGGFYSKGDAKDEADYCGIDFYDASVALCPKTWSTSPGMMVYDVSEGRYAGNRAEFERNACKEGKSAKSLAADNLAKFKSTMNAKGTSGTFAPSSLLYYHFSRYFDATVKVPVVVWRSMDAKMHQSEVADPGLSLSGGRSGGRMNHEGWRAFAAADRDPGSYRPTDELFTSDRSQIYGVLLSSPGHRYGSEINGTRKSGWGKGQNEDFQQTPAFIALRSDKPLEEAIAEGLREGLKDRQIARDLGEDGTPQQMVFWMKELSEIILLDFIFSQQDRVGNIDFTPYYYWAENGKLKSKKAKHHERGDGSVPPEAVLMRRTNLNDNDAGGRVQYANFAKSTQMLEKLRHFGPETYRKLMALDADLQAQGPIYQWVATRVGLDDGQIAQVVKNTAFAAGILRSTCTAGKLTFDLDPETYFVTGAVDAAEVACDGA
ncbi:hypothetical protein TRL7639_04174 [Falsiruegeria litorea R37]|uniref:Uncharacterized protein n=1 Tax=Falsiruegeria litorea R37 TaxID=1200284 RepID=A0A1Y5TXS3_9RHOB|nr:hypothetical protein [Falsiruegeria litorea]SLN70567.1 hypothetical protein TRL7639_04174 [Falsiruegeria litorea R37]